MAFKASVQREKLEQIAEAQGCSVDIKASYVLIKKGTSKNCLFVAKTKEVSRVDIGGFDHSDPLIKNLGGESHGCVHQQIRNDIPVSDFTAIYTVLCKGLDTFPSHPKKERARPHGFKRSKHQPIAGPTVEVKSEETPAQHMERLVAELAKKEQIATEMGFPLSPKTIESFRSKIEELRKQVEV